MGGRVEEKNACIQTGGLAELMGTRRGAFLQGNHLHNGKVVGVGAESSPLVGTVSEVEGESSYQIDDHYQVLEESEMYAGDMLFCFLSPAHFICKTIYQQSLRHPQPICTREFAPASFHK